MSLFLDTSKVAGSDTQIQYNNAGEFGADSGFTFNNSDKSISLLNATLNTTASFTGILNSHTKTAGATATNDDFYGQYNFTVINDSGEDHGTFYGLRNWARIQAGSIGDVGGTVKSMYGIDNYTQIDDTVSQLAFGFRSEVRVTGTGVVSSGIRGARVEVDMDASSSISSGDMYVLDLQGTSDGTIGSGSAYMLYMNDDSSMDFNIYQAGANANHLGGALGVDGDLTTDGDLYTTAYTEYSGTSTITGWSGTPGVLFIRYKKIGNLVYVQVFISGTSNATTTSFTLPYSSVNVSGLGVTQPALIGDNGTRAMGYFSMGANSNLVSVVPSATGSASSWTASGGKEVFGQFWFEAQ